MNANDIVIAVTILLVFTLTLIVINGVWKFGEKVFEHKKPVIEDDKYLYSILDNLARNTSTPKTLIQSFVKFFDNYDSRRNEFWTSYGQIIICIFIICVITILLLTKVISAEAGLPILSAVSGFAIAKGTNIKNDTSLPPTNEN